MFKIYECLYKFRLLTLLSVLLILGCSDNTGSIDTNSANANQPNTTTQITNNHEIRFMAAEQSGTWYSLAVGITQMLKKAMPDLGNISILPGGGISNVVGIESGQANIGFSQASSIVDALNGHPPFTKKTENVRYILTLFPHKTQIVVFDKSGIQNIEDIRGKRINVGTKGLLTEDVARRALEVYGMGYSDMASVQNLSFSDAVVEMKDGRLDAMFWTVPSPFAVLTDLSQSENVRFLSLPEDKRKLLIDVNPGFTRSVIEAGTYKGVDSDVDTIQSPLVMIANKNASEDLIYQITKVVYENLVELQIVAPNLKDITQQDLIHDFGVPMHAGASRYFKEIGVLE